MAAKLRPHAGPSRAQGVLALIALTVAGCLALLLASGAKAGAPDPSSCIPVPEVFVYDPTIPSPGNDFFADAAGLLPAAEGCAVADNTNADLFGTEADEIVSQGDTDHHPQSPSGSGQTVWFKWTPSSARSAIFDTYGSQVNNTIITV